MGAALALGIGLEGCLGLGMQQGDVLQGLGFKFEVGKCVWSEDLA